MWFATARQLAGSAFPKSFLQLPQTPSHFMRTKFLLTLLLLCQFTYGQSQAGESFWQQNFWTAKWIALPTADSKAYGIYHFRKTIDIPQNPLVATVKASITRLSICPPT